MTHVESIVSIVETNESDWKRIDGKSAKNAAPYAGWSGWIITTTDQEIFFGITNVQDCCEDWGTEFSIVNNGDDLQFFVGAALLGIDQIIQNADGTYTEVAVQEEGNMFDYTNTIFINVRTNRGTFTLTVYNHHNGYYGHAVMCKSRQLTIDTSI